MTPSPRFQSAALLGVDLRLVEAVVRPAGALALTRPHAAQRNLETLQLRATLAKIAAARGCDVDQPAIHVVTVVLGDLTLINQQYDRSSDCRALMPFMASATSTGDWDSFNKGP